MTEARRDSDKELFETIGKVKEFMANYERNRLVDQEARAEDREESRTWREDFACKQQKANETIEQLKNRVDNLTAPARWAVGIAAIITTLGVVAAYAKKFFFWVKSNLG